MHTTLQLCIEAGWVPALVIPSGAPDFVSRVRAPAKDWPTALRLAEAMLALLWRRDVYPVPGQIEVVYDPCTETFSVTLWGVDDTILEETR